MSLLLLLQTLELEELEKENTHLYYGYVFIAGEIVVEVIRKTLSTKAGRAVIKRRRRRQYREKKTGR